MNYINTFIRTAPDSKAKKAGVPIPKAEKKTIAVLEYELISASPYTHTQEEIQFSVYAQRQGITADELKKRKDKLWKSFFSKPCACMRTSPLAKSYGWGLHFDKNGRVALVPIQSVKYQQLAKDPSIKQTQAMRSSRE